MPSPVSAPRTSVTSLGRVRGVPSLCMNSGPGIRGRIAMYANTALTGHILEWVQPTYRVWPAPNGSVLLAHNVTTKRVGLA